MPFERGSAVDIETDSLLLKNGSAVKVKWPRDLLVPSLKSIDIKNSLVDIKLYERNMNSESQPSRELATLASNIPNTGETDFVIPDLSDMIGEGICEVSIKVEVKSLPTSSNLQIRRSIPKFVPFILPAAAALLRFSIWAGKLYLRSNIKKKVLCQLWVNSQPPGRGDEILNLVSTFFPCPPTVDRAQAENSGFEKDLKDSQIWGVNFFNDLQRKFFHPNTSVCYRQRCGFE